MSGMELNKIMAAVLVAGITATLAGFIARETVHPHYLHEDAVRIEGVEEGGTGIVKQTLPEPVLDLIAAADVARGEKISRACTACHTFEKGGPHGTGPNLWGIIGRARASIGDFGGYSDAMEAVDGKWDYAALNHFLWKPKTFVEGTNMNFIGLKKPEDRAALMAWLRTMAASPPSLPSAAEIAAEQVELAPPPAEEEEQAANETGDEVEPAAGH